MPESLKPACRHLTQRHAPQPDGSLKVYCASCDVFMGVVPPENINDLANQNIDPSTVV